MSTLEEIENLIPDFQYVEEDRIVLTVGIRATFYFWDGHTANKRNALVECVEAYEQDYGSKLSWAFDAERHKVIPFTKMRPLSELVQSMDEDDRVEWYVSSGDDDAVGDYRISALTERGWQNGEMSVVSFTLPVDHAYVEEKRATLVKLTDLFAKKLSPFHGHVGLAAISTYEQYQYQSDEIDVATRYRGLFIEYPAIDVSHAHKGLKSVDWITFIGKSFAERVGGLTALVNFLRNHSVDLKETPTGIFIMAGPTPNIGKIEDGLPQRMAHVNALLRPFRDGTSRSMGFGSINGELRFNRCTSDLWIRRLDYPEVWPPASFIGLPRVPVGRVPKKRLQLKTGDVCVVYGRYRHSGCGPVQDEDDETPQVVLLPKDIAPFWLQLGPHGEYLDREIVKWELVAEL